MGFYQAIKEAARQQLEQDDLFLTRELFFFDLRIPQAVAVVPTMTRFFFPLILPPQSYSLEEPFAVELTRTQLGGLYVEENGIIDRRIRLRGTTGFRPRQLPLMKANRSNVAVPAAFDASHKSHARSLPHMVYSEISGLRHLQYLQDSVFRTYADLKKDPTTAKDTSLVFHNAKDQDSWFVAPERFVIEKNSSNPFLYTYSIDLIALGPAGLMRMDFSEDTNLIQKVKNVIGTVRGAVQMASGAIQDLNRILGEVTQVVKNAVGIINDVNTILTAAQDFVNGTTDLINVPFAFLQATINTIDNVVATVQTGRDWYDNLKNYPDTIDQYWERLVDSLELIGVDPTKFETPWEAYLKSNRNQQESRSFAIEMERRTQSSDVYTESQLPRQLQKVSDLNRIGTALTEGDVISMQGTITDDQQRPVYKSAKPVKIGDGDTLASLAAHYLGDARRWQDIAMLNGMKPPFIDRQADAPLAGSTSGDESPFAGTLGLGDEIVVPSNMESPLTMTLLPVAGAEPTENLATQVLGTDFKIAPIATTLDSSRTLYDIPINTELGSVDAATVSGLDNLSQVLTTRVLIEKGMDALYQNVGVARIVGLGFKEVDVHLIKFQITEALLADPRISSVQSIEMTQQDDALDLRIVVNVRGYNESRVLRVTI